MAKRASKLLAWTDWCHMEGASVYLPSGVELRVNRGGEQGDPLGPVYCLPIIADIFEVVRERLHAKFITSLTVFTLKGFSGCKKLAPKLSQTGSGKCPRGLFKSASCVWS